MKYSLFFLLLFFVSGVLYGVNDDIIDMQLHDMEEGRSGVGTRAEQITQHFGRLIEEHSFKVGDSDLRKQLAQLDDNDFQRLVAGISTRSGGGGGWSLLGGGKSSDGLVVLITELNRLRSENERVARENENLIREKYSKCKAIVWVITTLCLGSAAANSILGTQLSGVLNASTATVAAALNATTGTS